MVFLEEVVESLFPLTRYLYEDTDRKVSFTNFATSGRVVKLKFLLKDLLTEDQQAERFSLAKTAARAVIKRLFVTMTAQTRGWAFAKDLNFLQEGGEADSNWPKVAKAHAKKVSG